MKERERKTEQEWLRREQEIEEDTKILGAYHQFMAGPEEKDVSP